MKFIIPHYATLIIFSIIVVSSIACENKATIEKENSVLMNDLLIIDSPIQSVCITPNTPGSKIPSHGTTKYGEMYAIDFVVIDKAGRSKKPYKPSPLTYLLRGIRLNDFYGWGEKVYSPVGGEVIKVIDGIEERNPVNVYRDIRNTIKVTKDYEEGILEYSSITGNCVIIKSENGIYALLAHLKQGSIVIKEGYRLQSKELVGELGHSGNSTMPHLHMQFMDNPDFKKARGIPFVFREYFLNKDGQWVKYTNSLPTKDDIVRFE